jgi:hypothetical protein
MRNRFDARTAWLREVTLCAAPPDWRANQAAPRPATIRSVSARFRPRQTTLSPSRQLDLEEYLASVASGEIDYLVFELASPIVVRLYTELYERHHGDWQIVWEHATAIPNDFDLFLESIKPPH